MIIFCHGTDSFRVYQKLAEIKSQFSAKISQAGLSIEEFEADISWEKLHQALYTFGFLASKRLVILKNILSDYKDKKVVTALLENFVKINSSDKVQLIIIETDKPKKDKETKSLFGKLSKLKYSYKFDKLKPGEIGNWIRSEAGKRGAKISSGAINKLANNAQDLWQVSNILDTAIVYAGEEEVDEKIIGLFLSIKVDDNIFNLVDAIVQNQHRKALELINGQLNAGVNENYLLSMIERQFGILVLLRDELDKNSFINSKNLAKKLGQHPYVVQKGLAQARAYSMEKLRQVYDKLIYLDSALKREGESEVLLSLLAIKK